MRPLHCQHMLGRKLARCGLYADMVARSQAVSILTH
jgi:hypothetical protein